MELTNYQNKDGIAYLSIARPEKKNALNFQVVDELKKHLRRAENDESVRAIILKGEGDAFCAGADLEYLAYLQGLNYDDNLKDSQHLAELFNIIYHFTKPVIAQVHGAAMAGGCGLAAVCDYTFATPDTKFGFTEVRIGFVPAIVSIFLIKKCGEGKAREMLLFGETFEGHQAKEYGLVNKLAESDDLGKTVLAFAQKIVKNNSGNSMAETKQLIAEVADTDIKEALDIAAVTNARVRASADCKKGISAFLAKEKISW